MHIVKSTIRGPHSLPPLGHLSGGGDHYEVCDTTLSTSSWVLFTHLVAVSLSEKNSMVEGGFYFGGGERSTPVMGFALFGACALLSIYLGGGLIGLHNVYNGDAIEVIARLEVAAEVEFDPLLVGGIIVGGRV
ncbi:hypothetical protein ACLOJK_007115 [Asimina triloba]